MLPNLSGPVKAYMQKMTFGVISKQVVDCEVIEVVTQVTTRGVRQPLPPQKLDIYKDGQRAWKYECLHLLPKPSFNPDDIVIWKSKKYRVIEKYDCSEYGYIEYLIAQTFEDDEESSSAGE